MNDWLFAALIGLICGLVLGIGGLVAWFAVRWRWY